MKIIYLGFIFLLAAATADAKDKMRFQGMDKDGNGIITRQEWSGNDQSFRNHDWNDDGVLSGNEVRSGAKKDESDIAPARFPDRFDFLDRNDDGVISRGEWDGTRGSFNLLDDNGDDLLSRGEYLDGR